MKEDKNKGGGKKETKRGERLRFEHVSLRIGVLRLQVNVRNSVCVCFGGFQKRRGGKQRVDERRLAAKQSISPSHRPRHTSQTRPSLLTQ